MRENKEQHSNARFNQIKFTKDYGNYGFMFDTVPENIMKELSHEVNSIKNNFESAKRHGSELAGQISKEYALKFSSEVEKYIFDLCKTYELESGGSIKNKFHSIADIRILDLNKVAIPIEFMPKLAIDTPWVNFQSKGEYNPPHSHSGLLSVVIWYDTPFTVEDEENLHRSKYPEDKIVKNGMFSFMSSLDGEISNYPIPVDKSFNGTICIFPSNLIHHVNPFFSSDKYRISISCNIFFDNIYESIDNVKKIAKK